MTRVLVDDQALGSRESPHQPFGVLERRELVEFTGDAQIRRPDLLRVSLPGHALAELVEPGFVGDAGHVHEADLEGRRRLFEDRVKAGLVADRRHRDRADARLVGGRDGAEERAEAVAGQTDAVRIDLRAGQQPVDRGRAGRDPRGHAEVDVEHRALVLAGTVERQHGHAARQPPVAIHGDADLLEAVHAGERHHDGDASATIAGRQVQPRRQRLAAGQRNPRRLDVVVGEPGVLRIALALPAVVKPVRLVVLVDRPLRGGPVDARHEIVLAGRHQVLVLLGRLRLGLATAGDRLEGGRGVGELRDALANRGKVGVGLRAARDGKINGPRLIPVHPDRADRVVEQPALLGPATRQRSAVSMSGPVASGSGAGRRIGGFGLVHEQRTVGHVVTSL